MIPGMYEKPFFSLENQERTGSRFALPCLIVNNEIKEHQESQAEIYRNVRNPDTFILKLVLKTTSTFPRQGRPRRGQ